MSSSWHGSDNRRRQRAGDRHRRRCSFCVAVCQSGRSARRGGHVQRGEGSDPAQPRCRRSGRPQPYPQWAAEVRRLTDGRGVDHVVETGAIDTLPQSLAACAANAELALVAALGPAALDATALRGLVTIRRVFVGSRKARSTSARSSLPVRDPDPPVFPIPHLNHHPGATSS
jgi:hypothetical protein